MQKLAALSQIVGIFACSVQSGTGVRPAFSCFFLPGGQVTTRMSLLFANTRRAWRSFGPSYAVKHDAIAYVQQVGRRSLSATSALLDKEEDDATAPSSTKGELVDHMQDNSMKELLCLAVKAPLIPGTPRLCGPSTHSSRGFCPSWQSGRRACSGIQSVLVASSDTSLCAVLPHCWPILRGQ